jgi:TonB family protein
MSSSFTIRTDIESKESSFIPVGIFSFVVHIVVFFVVPIATKILWQPKQFVRPPTFQLVTKPQPVTEVKPKKKIVRKKKKKAKRAVPKSKANKSAKPKPREEEEDLSELEELLEDLPQPVSQINVGKPFKYSWYINYIQAKIERNWKPHINDESLEVVLNFIIYRTGKISDVKIQKSSGNSTLDNLAIRAVKLAAPFKKLPHGYKDTKIELFYTLVPAVR